MGALCFAAGSAAVAALPDGPARWSGLALLALTGAAALVARPAPRRAAPSRCLDRGQSALVDAYAAAVERARYVEDLEANVGELGGEAGLVDARLVLLVDGQWRRLDAVPPVPVDPRVAVWLGANQRLLRGDRLAEVGAGGLRAPIAATFAALGARLLLPLVHRDELVGAVVAAGVRARRLRRNGAVLLAAKASTARALAKLRLAAAAHRREAVAAEVDSTAELHHRPAREVAEAAAGSAVAVHRPGRRLARTFHSAADDGGDLWLSIGEVTGGGVPAALLGAMVAGAAEGARRGAAPPQRVLARLDDVVRGAEDPVRHPVSCFAARLAPSGELTFAGAGHPFPFVVRARGLSSLVARGTRLGLGEAPTLPGHATRLEPGDAIVLVSGSLLAARSRSGLPYREARLRRCLAAAPPGLELAELVLEDLERHLGGAELEDDVAVLVARVSGPGG